MRARRPVDVIRVSDTWLCSASRLDLLGDIRAQGVNVLGQRSNLGEEHSHLGYVCLVSYAAALAFALFSAW